VTERAKIVIKSEEKRLVYGEVYAPMRVDTDTEAMTAEDIEKMAHAFLARGKTDCIDVQHSMEESGCVVVESFIARKEDPDGFIQGAWVLGVKVIPEELWQAIKSGELNGFSFAGIPGDRVTARATVRQAKRLVGETEKSTDSGPIPSHSHEVNLTFSSDGKIIPTNTEETYGHVHGVRKATATEPAFDHSHRMVLIEN
jgi:hypothetical protein